MTHTARRAVITGMGVVTPLGLDLETFWQSLRAGKSGVRRLQSLDVGELPVQIGAEIDNFDPKEYLEKKDRKRLPVMPRTFQFAVAAARMAVEQAHVTPENTDRARLATVFGSATVPSGLAELGRAAQVCANCQPMSVDLRRWGAEGLPLIPPMWILSHIPNMIGCHVSIVHDAQGPSNTVTQTDIGALLAAGEAWRMIRHDKADVALVGSADTTLNFLNVVRQCLFAPLSRANDAPERACRPFDRGRDGIVLGEGGGVLIMEDLEHARRRGAMIYAEIVGFSSTLDRSAERLVAKGGVPRDRNRPYPPRGGRNGLIRAVRQALAQAGIAADELDHVNAHGYSTVADDAWEAQSLQQVFEGASRAVPVFAPKSYFGSLGAGGGAVELIAGLLAMQHGALPPNLNYTDPDPACPINVNTAWRPIERPHFLKIGFSELGQVAAVVFRKWQ